MEQAVQGQFTEVEMQQEPTPTPTCAPEARRHSLWLQGQSEVCEALTDLRAEDTQLTLGHTRGKTNIFWKNMTKSDNFPAE